MKDILSTQPYKGTEDLLFDDFQIQKYIFDIWREICLRFNYKEYITPVLESAQIYEAKSGTVRDELFALTDRGGRNLALRPEMTPSITRAVLSQYKKIPKPIRLFSIANFFRNEAPQKGRLREFWQLNFDIFGSASLEADGEIISMAIEIMLAFGAPKDSFKLFLNNRILINELFDLLEVTSLTRDEVARIMDKYNNLPREEIVRSFKKINLDEITIDKILLFLDVKREDFEEKFPQLTKGNGYDQIKYVLNYLDMLGYADFCEFKPSIIRGFDYYDGTVFEVFDQNPSNKRSLFGGGRYNGLGDIFGEEKIPATGFAPGSTTTRLFLENWNLIPNLKKRSSYYLPYLKNTKLENNLILARQIRAKGKVVETDFYQKDISDALSYANKQNFLYVLLIGENEKNNGQITIKNLVENKQETKTLEKFLTEIR